MHKYKRSRAQCLMRSWLIFSQSEMHERIWNAATNLTQVDVELKQHESVSNSEQVKHKFRNLVALDCFRSVLVSKSKVQQHMSAENIHARIETSTCVWLTFRVRKQSVRAFPIGLCCTYKLWWNTVFLILHDWYEHILLPSFIYRGNNATLHISAILLLKLISLFIYLFSGNIIL